MKIWLWVVCVGAFVGHMVHLLNRTDFLLLLILVTVCQVGYHIDQQLETLRRRNEELMLSLGDLVHEGMHEILRKQQETDAPNDHMALKWRDQ